MSACNSDARNWIRDQANVDKSMIIKGEVKSKSVSMES
jgi:hypothetical protein